MASVIIYSTAASEEEAEKLASALVNERLAACVQLSQIESIYSWDGEVCDSPEIRLSIKTGAALYRPLETFIKTRHSYEVPQIVMTSINSGSEEYLEWIDQNTGGTE